MLKVYITDLAAYNKGNLYGEWVTLPLDKKELIKKIQQILMTGEAVSILDENCYEVHEEWFITDYEWEEVALTDIDEYEDIYKLNEQLDFIQGASSTHLKAMKFLLSEQITLDIEDAYYRAEDVIIHEDKTMEDVAYNLLQECYEIDKLPSIIANNIDYYSIGQELELDGNYTSINGSVFEYIG